MWAKIFQEYISDHVAFVVHAYLLSGDLLATWAVAAGIIWESVFRLRKIAHRLVIWGVVVETLCSLALFTFDEGISSAQQSTIDGQQAKIIALETQISSALHELAHRHFDDNQKKKFVATLQEGGIKTISVYWLFGDDEIGEFVSDLTSAVSEFGDNSVTVLGTSSFTTPPRGVHSSGVNIYVVGENPEARRIAGILDAALAAGGIRRGIEITPSKPIMPGIESPAFIVMPKPPSLEHMFVGPEEPWFPLLKPKN